MTSPNQSLHIALNEIHHLRTELTAKNELINQLEQRIKELTTTPTTPTKLTEPPIFNGNWVQSAKALLDLYVNPKTDKPLTGQKKILAEFAKAIQGCEQNEYINDVWKCINAYVGSFTQATATKYKKTCNIMTCIRLLNTPANNEFDVIQDTWDAKVKASKICRVMTEDELVFMQMNDGRYVTTAVLQERCDAVTDAYQRMALTTAAFHGNRWQDWCGIKYGKSNFESNDRGYYDTDQQTMNLYEGKTHGKKLAERVFKVHTIVSKAIQSYHESTDCQCLFPHCTPTSINRTKSITADAMTLRLQQWFFNGESMPKLPINDTRHMYETHIRYVAKLSDDELENEWKAIAHSGKTARQRYAELYKLTVL